VAGSDCEARRTWSVDVISEGTPERREVERALVGRQVALPFASRAAVVALPEFSSAAFFGLRDRDNEWAFGFAVESRAAPLLSGYRLLRVSQFGGSLPIEAADTVVTALHRWTTADSRVLRLTVDVFSFDEDRRIALGDALRRHGLRLSEHPHSYVETLVIDLSASEEELFKGLHYSARRKIRQLARFPLAIRPVTDPSLAGRMNQLAQETLARTRGQFRWRDWGRRITLSAEHPQLSRIVGLFHTERSGADSLLAFAWGCHGGDHAFYAEAASTRDTGGLRVALAYGVMWDLIVWAKRSGARWFDLGGITHGTHHGDDPLGGISDFKRYFSRRVVKVRDEWILMDHSWRASLAEAVHKRLRRG
jgi:hypothetical protein